MKRSHQGFELRKRDKKQVYRAFPEDNALLEALIEKFNASNSALASLTVQRQEYLRDFVGEPDDAPHPDLPLVSRADEEASLVKAEGAEACSRGMQCEGYVHFRLVPKSFRHGMCVLCIRSRVLRAYLYAQITGCSYISSFYIHDYSNRTDEYTEAYTLRPGQQKWQGLGGAFVLHSLKMLRREGDRIVQLYPRHE